MKLIDLLPPEHVVVSIEGETLRLAADSLLRALVSSGAIEDVAKVEELVAETLPRDVVTVGQAFLLYFRTEAVPKLVAGMGIAAQPMHREHDAAKTARIVLLIAAPPSDSSHFLRAVNAFSRALGRDEIVEPLLVAKSAAEVLAIQPLCEIELLGYLTVRDVMVRRQVKVRPDATLGEVAKVMVDQNVPSVLVASDTNEVLGMVTHAVLLQYMLPVHVKRLTGEFGSAEAEAQLEDPSDMAVREVMERSVLCLSEDQTVAEVANMMQSRKVDRFPVVRDGALVGFLTRGDIVRRLFGR